MRNGAVHARKGNAIRGIFTKQDNGKEWKLRKKGTQDSKGQEFVEGVTCFTHNSSMKYLKQ